MLIWELCTEGFSGRALGRVACKDMEEAGMGRAQVAATEALASPVGSSVFGWLTSFH